MWNCTSHRHFYTNSEITMAHFMRVLLLISLALAGPVLSGSNDSLPKYPNSSGSNDGNRNKLGPQKAGEKDRTHSTGGVSPPTSQEDLFRLSHDGWSPCERKNETSCGRTLRNIRCAYIAESRPVPMHFCASFASSQPTFQPCDSCPEDCATTVWSAWSECSSTCSPATRFRTRRVLTASRHGGLECGALSERELCSELEDCEIEVIVPIYTWKIGEWSSCRRHAEGTCGLGQRFRSLSCVDSQGEVVDNNLCSDNQDPHKRGTQPPSGETCSIPCDCQTSLWSAWGACSRTCRNQLEPAQSGPVQTRTREIVTLPENGGLPCPRLAERRECEGETLPDCPRFEWVAEEWQPCRLSPDNDGVCGAGRQKRQVYCIQEGDEDRIPVNQDNCINLSINSTLLEPPMKRACWVDCPVDCQLGEWQNWSPCSQSCEEGIQVRTREVLVPAAFGGMECGPLAEAKECEFVECTWWYTSRWSSCFLKNDQTDCGTGSHIRTVYCMSALDEFVEDEECLGSSPAHREQCRIPCPTDCVISEWTEWGSCSKTCGKKGGVQMRTRHILAYSDLEEDACLPESELSQMRPCNLHLSCQSYTWQVGAWEGCTVVNTSVAAARCGEGAGGERREVSCEKETGVASDESFCDPASKPVTQRACDLPCPVDCKLSAWSTLSSCSVTCGANGRRAQLLIVVRLPAHGGTPCPEGADEDGRIARVVSCDDLPPCYNYQWNTGNWTECEMVATDCGKGLQTREVHCGRNDGARSEPGVCLRELLSSPPPSHQQCLVLCAGDCLLSDWTVLGPCVHDCGDTGHGGYCRMRSRTIISIDPATDNAEELCPHITSSDLRNYVQCDDVKLSYEWRSGPWQSCLLSEGEECGAGNMHRSVLCQRSDGTFVPDHFCEAPSVSTQRVCDVPCAVDCIVSDWMDWSPCTQACGQGFKTRMRNVQQQSARGGRNCPPLIDSMICIEMLCDVLEWEVSQWGSCDSINPRSNCGSGAQTRTVTCKAGDSLEPECDKRFPKPDGSRGCVLPCPGDCVMTDWSDDAPCPSPCQQNSSKSQIRSVIRHPTVTGEQCGDLTQAVLCTEADCISDGYRLVTGEWSHCKAVSGECGSGMRHRTVNCINGRGFPVAMHHCPPENITTSDTCNIPCPVSCEPKEYSDWSVCNVTCGLHGVIERSRVMEGYSGKKCSKKFSLSQTMSCNSVPCHIYVWVRSLWSECEFETERGCGYGERTRFVECQRSDGLTVDHEYCIIQENPDARNPDVLNQILSGGNETELDIETSQRCEKPCPGDCLTSSWSPTTSCYTSCYSPDDPSYTTRSRAVTRPARPGGVACPETLIDHRSCPAEQAVCPDFSWQTGLFYAATRTRDVWCQIEDNTMVLNVTGGCVEALRPSSVLDCNPQCIAQGAICDQGRCRCNEGFEGNGQTCFPTSGCTSDEHCPLPYTVCNPIGQCVCMPLFVLDTTSGLCTDSNVIPDGNVQAGSRPTSVGPEDGNNNVEQYEGKSNIWKWVVIASILMVAILAIIIGIFLIRRRRAREIGFNPIPTISDSDFQLTKMVKEAVTKC